VVVSFHTPEKWKFFADIRNECPYGFKMRKKSMPSMRRCGAERLRNAVLYNGKE
jgi:hypothetical protein